MRKFVVMLAFGGLVVGLGAVPAAAGGGNVNQFCKAWLAVKAAEDPSPRQLNRVQDTAPPDIADAVENALGLFEELGEDAFGDPAFTAAFADINGFVVDECGYQGFDVAMQDFAFDGVPDEIEKGKVAFTLTNEGVELHELGIVRLKGDATIDDLLEASEEDFEDLATEVKGGGFAFPGASDTAFFNLKKTGNYVALCFIPVGTTPDTIEGGGEGGSGPPHFVEGMAAEFEVTS